jgi:hypothetical protein
LPKWAEYQRDIQVGTSTINWISRVKVVLETDVVLFIQSLNTSKNERPRQAAVGQLG